MFTAEQVIAAISPLLDDVVRLSDTVRIVGTASSALRGIVLPVADVDVLAKNRDTADELVAASGSPRAAPVETPFGYQYLADHQRNGMPVRFSTVESNVTERQRLAECVGGTPWRYYSLVAVAGRPVPVVASELRLASDLVHGRPDRWRPIAAHLLANRFDPKLLSRAVFGFPQSLLVELRHALGG